MKLRSLIIVAMTGTMVFTSCLKSHNTTDLLNDNGSIVTAIADVGPTGGTNVITVTATPVIETVDFITLRVYAPGNNKPSGPVHVKLAVTAASGYDQIPASGYSLPLEYNVPAGTTGLTIPITLNKNSLDLTKNYGIQISIASVSQGVIAENDKTMIVSFIIKSIYDGIYTVVSGNVQRYTAPGSPEPITPGGLNGSLAGNPDVYLVTAGPTSVQVPLPLTPGALFWAFGSGSQVAGIDGLRAAVDPATNLVTMTSVLNPTLANWAGHVNNYNPATKTFNIAMKWTSTAPAYREYEIVLHYNRPRP